MPELPEVETVKNALRPLVKSKTIRDIDIFYAPILRNKTEKAFKKILENKTIKDITRYGKYLLFNIGEYTLISHLRMEGKYYLKPLNVKKDKHDHIIFYFSDGDTLRYNDVRKFGTMDLIKTKELFLKDPLKKLGPEPFEDRCTNYYLKQKLENKKIAIKSALLDQTIICGLGNIYVNEVLFKSHIHPTTPSNELSLEELDIIIQHARETLKKAIKLGGTTIRTYHTTDGVDGKFQNELLVHGKEGDSCLVCESIIIKTKVGGRGTYLCPTCQNKKA
ncbi:MAG: DNA-formamidopyrimidine glycosylase [Candidatus Izimaplasma sp.]|nr:DNA-formamidopyrimidine glycosylase [Candidatus Izimaplasma bacterium]